MMKTDMAMVASVGLDSELGKGGDLCWHIREDLLHFKETTMGGAVIMGRKTWESLPRKPLPGRLNIVVTSNPDSVEGECIRATSLEEALSGAGELNAYIIGGESLYRQAMPLASRLEITKILEREPDADTFFPEIDSAVWALERESETMTSVSGISYIFQTYRRK